MENLEQIGWFLAKVAELVDALDLGSSVERRESSSLSFRTIQFVVVLYFFTFHSFWHSPDTVLVNRCLSNLACYAVLD